MRARFRSWWQQIKQHSFIVTGTIIVLVVAIAFIFAAYRFGWSGTGFLNKTVWDWLQLLIIPVVLALIALLFNLATTRNDQKITQQRYQDDQKITAQRYENDQKIAQDKQREDLLQVYLDRMSELMLKEQLLSSEVDAGVRNVARVRTLTILYQLDARRIGYVSSFLSDAGLMSPFSEYGSIVSLRGANLNKINLSQVQMVGADLSGALLKDANLSSIHIMKSDLTETGLAGANLSRANILATSLTGAILGAADLTKARLLGVDMMGAMLFGANLSGSKLTQVNLERANLMDANLSGAYLKGVNLVDASLFGADLTGANLSGINPLEELSKKYSAMINFDDTQTTLHQSEIDLTGANLQLADLTGANLRGVIGITPEQLEQAESLKGATMPDGSIHP